MWGQVTYYVVWDFLGLLGYESFWLMINALLRGKRGRQLFKVPLLKRLPTFVNRFLGYREYTAEFHPHLFYLSAFFGTMAAMLANQAMAMHSPLFKNHFHFPQLVPSFAATCTLIYGEISSPLAQPRNLFFGHFISGLIGVSLTKLFLHAGSRYMWICASLSCACSAVTMEFFGIVHAPGGATAVLPSLDADTQKLGWNYLPVLLIHCCVFMGIALLVNNVFQRYPTYWLFPNLAPPEVRVTAKKIDIPPNLLTKEEIEMLEKIQLKL